MKISTYISILKYLRKIGDNNVRILGGEPIIFPDIRKYIDIAEKGGFNIIVFSNINITPLKFQKIFIKTKNIRVNCNINDKSFYTSEERENIKKNLTFLQSEGIPTIIGYNIVNLNTQGDFAISLARQFKITNINLKITNSCLGEDLFIDTGTKEFGDYIYHFIKQYYKEFEIELSCGISKGIFTKQQIEFITQRSGIHIYFGCDGHRGRFDINTDGSIFKCYPLESLYKKDKVFIRDLLKSNIPLEETLHSLYSGVFSSGECTAHTFIKEKMLLGV